MTNTQTSTYKSQQARDAESAGYGKESYWQYLDDAAVETSSYFAKRGMLEQAELMMTRPLWHALQGNEGD